MKPKLLHGKFEEYCETHHPEISETTRKNYMRVGTRFSKGQLIALLDLLPTQVLAAKMNRSIDGIKSAAARYGLRQSDRKNQK